MEEWWVSHSLNFKLLAFLFDDIRNQLSSHTHRSFWIDLSFSFSFVCGIPFLFQRVLQKQLNALLSEKSNWISGFSSLISHYPAPSHWVNGNHIELCRWGNNIKLTHHIPSGITATVMTLASRRKGTGRVLHFNLLVALTKHLWFILKYNTLCFREGISFYVLQG